MVPSNPAAVHASFTALTLPSGWSWRNSFTKLVLPGVTVAVLVMLEAAFSLAAILEFPRRLPVSPSCFRTTLMTGRLIVPFIPAAVHASFTALALAWGLPWRNSLTKLVLPGVAVTVFGLLAAAFPLAAVLEYPRRLPVSFTLVLLTRVGLIVPSNPAACHASFTVLVVPSGWSLRNCLTKLVLPGVAVAVLGMLEASFSLAAFLVFPGRLPVSPSCFRTWLMMG